MFHRIFLIVLFPIIAFADEPLTIAVASNFLSTATEITAVFTERTGIEVRLSGGSTGKLYAQIVHGAPYDIFLSADSERPAILEEKGIAISGSRWTYAIGSLVLWSADSSLSDRNCREVLEQGDFRRLAIANPDSAPYGRTAKEFMESEGLWNKSEQRLVYGENIAQTFLFVATGNATLGLIALSQVRSANPGSAGCIWRVPATAYSSLDQQAVTLARSENKTAASRFIRFLQSPDAAMILNRRGYSVPDR